MIKRATILLISATGLYGCGSTPLPPSAPTSNASFPASPISAPKITPIPRGGLSLPDRVAFSQKDPRWSSERLGNSSDTMGTDGCLVTATSMALANLGFVTNPSDLNARLTQTDSFTPRGWLIWDGIRKVTAGEAEAVYHTEASEGIINSCMRQGQYPLVQFYLKSGRSHWAMITKRDGRGYHMRDPLRPSKSALIFPRSSDSFKAVRCVGLKA
ncbi:hypothetical protein N9W89_02030 [Hellea sp.]|nr:hypothetical protein [Hellea sp.]